MAPSYTAERTREPVYVDEFGARHHPPTEYQRPHRPRYGEEGRRDGRLPRRAHTYRDPPVPSSSNSASPSPPPRHRRRRAAQPPVQNPYESDDNYYAPPRRAPQPPAHEPYDSYDDYYAPRRRHPRDNGYMSDNRHNRPRHRSPKDDRSRRDRGAPREKQRSGARPKATREESKWQKEAKDMFREYAVPVIKAEGGKYISKQIGNLIAKQAAR